MGLYEVYLGLLVQYLLENYPPGGLLDICERQGTQRPLPSVQFSCDLLASTRLKSSLKLRLWH